MAIRLRLDKPWQPLTAEKRRACRASSASTRSPMPRAPSSISARPARARRSACAASCSASSSERGAGHQFRVEVNQQYRTRWFELLMVHQADHGSLPPDNAKNPPPNSGGSAPPDEATMDFEPNSEQQMLIDQVRRYVREEIIPLEAKLDPDASRARSRRLRAAGREDQGDGPVRHRHPQGVSAGPTSTSSPACCWPSRWRSIAPASTCPATAPSAARASPRSSRPTRTRRSATSIRPCAARRSRSSA